MGLQKLRRETFPDFSKPEVEIRIVYRGATAEEVEEVICERVEDALDGIRFVEYDGDRTVDGGGRVLLDPAGELISDADRGLPLLVLDSSWRRFCIHCSTRWPAGRGSGDSGRSPGSTWGSGFGPRPRRRPVRSKVWSTIAPKSLCVPI